MVQRQFVSHLQPFEQLRVHVQLHREAVVSRGIHDTFLSEVCSRHVIRSLVVSSRIAQRIILRRACAEQFVRPSRSLAQRGWIFEHRVLRLRVGSHHLVVQRSELCGVQQVESAFYLLDAIRCPEVETRRGIFLAFLCGDDNHTVGSS